MVIFFVSLKMKKYVLFANNSGNGNNFYPYKCQGT